MYGSVLNNFNNQQHHYNQRDSYEYDFAIEELVKKADETRRNLLILSINAALQLCITREPSQNKVSILVPMNVTVGRA